MSRVRSQINERRPNGADSTGRTVRVIRATLWLLIAGAGCYVTYGYSQLWQEWRKTQQPIDESSTAVFDPEVLSPGMPLEGPWSFAQLDWDVRSQFLSSAEVTTRLETLATSSATANDEKLPDLSIELTEVAQGLGAKATDKLGNRVFLLDRANLKARLIVRTVAGKDKVVAMAAALPHSAERWQYFELIPRGSAAANPVATKPQLLPLPPGARRDGGRFADDGRTLLELVTLDSNADELLSLWKTAGWEVRPGGAGSPDDFSFLCVRGDDVIYVWSADRRSSLQNLMLVRTPTSSDTMGTARSESMSW
jgi:hypothetical protein